MTDVTEKTPSSASQLPSEKRRWVGNLRRWFHKTQTFVEDLFGKASAFITWFLMRIFLVDRSYKEIRAKMSKPDKRIEITDVRSSRAKADLILEQAEKMYAVELERASSTKDKSKALLTLYGFTLAALAFLAPYVSVPGLVFACITTVLLAVWMLAQFLNVSTSMHPILDNEAVRATTAKLRKQLAYDYLHCAQFNSKVNEFLTDVYRTSFRLLTLALILLFFIALFSLPGDNWRTAPLESDVSARVDSIAGSHLSQIVALRVEEELDGFEERVATRLQDALTDHLLEQLQQTLPTDLQPLLIEQVATQLKADSTFLQEVRRTIINAQSSQ